MGLFTYPILQAADILLYQADEVPVGEDQRQHIELTRDLGQRFNTRFGETFTIPKVHIVKSTAKITDLQEPTSKMSKSASSVAGIIELLDDPALTLKKIKSAVTDTGREVQFNQSEKPGISNLLTIFSALSGDAIGDIEKRYADKGYGDFKKDVAEVVIGFAEPFKKRTEEIMSDKGELERILKVGSEKASVVAQVTLQRVYDAVGFIRR